MILILGHNNHKASLSDSTKTQTFEEINTINQKYIVILRPFSFNEKKAFKKILLCGD